MYDIKKIKNEWLRYGRKYYPCMKNVEFVFICERHNANIIIQTNDQQYFIDKFGMEARSGYLYMSGRGLGKYWELYWNAFIVMLEQSIHDPRLFIRQYKNDDIAQDMERIEDYMSTTKELWTGTSLAYNLYRNGKILLFDTYPKI